MELNDHVPTSAWPRGLFDLLLRQRYVSESLAEALRNMAGFRNILVHGYDTVDLAIVRDVVEHRLDDLLAFASAIRRVIRADDVG